jgi:carbon starvation protein
MNLTVLALGFLALLAAAYLLYGRFVARLMGLEDERTTPARACQDGIDFVPTPRFYLFAQHLSAIAAAGPIAGPILACQSFGWLPCLLWIGIGVVFIGAVHDFSALAASVRHDASSVAEIARAVLGGGAGRALLAFIWIALVYVIVAFADITAGTFVAGAEELRGVDTSFHAGGAVASASTFYLLLAIVMGFLQRRGLKLLPATLVFVPATFAAVWLGTRVSGLMLLDYRTWAITILVYCVIASVVPVWALLQPRGYLGGFVLFSTLAVGLVGMLFGGYTVEQPAFTALDVGGTTGVLFPFLFVTIACGACSGFHGLVCSGTTSKQIARESHMPLVGYGAMLAEGLVAVIALVTVMVVTREASAKLPPGAIYANGMGRFLTLIVGESNLRFAITFGGMAFSTFVFDTLDVCTRLGRYLLQELFGWRSRAGAVAATLLTILPPALILAFSESGAFKAYWTLFGASNQLLAALTLFAIGVWLRRNGRRAAFVFVPMAFVLVMTTWALARLALASMTDARAGGAGSLPALVNALASSALLVLAVFFVVQGLLRLRERAPAGEIGAGGR